MTVFVISTLWRDPFAPCPVIPSFRACREISLPRAPCPVIHHSPFITHHSKGSFDSLSLAQDDREPRYHSLRMTNSVISTSERDPLVFVAPCPVISSLSRDLFAPCSVPRYSPFTIHNSPFKGILRLVCDSLRMTDSVISTLWRDLFAPCPVPRAPSFTILKLTILKGIPPQDRNDGSCHPERVIASRRIPLPRVPCFKFENFDFGFLSSRLHSKPPGLFFCLR
jgi:hypothetical protein